MAISPTAALGKVTPGDVHSAQPGIVSITNLTEAGTAYTAAEIAALVHFLASPASRYHTGDLVKIDGGWMA